MELYFLYRSRARTDRLNDMAALLIQHVQGHILGLFRPGLLPSGTLPNTSPDGSGILTEGGDFLVTESGDYIVTE